MHPLKKAVSLFLNKQESILSASLVVMLMIALSRVLGLVRYRLLAHFFGDKLFLLDNFIAASLVPESIFEVLIFGTVAIAFIPVFSSYLAQDREEDAWRLVSSLIAAGTVLFLVVSVLLFIFATQVAQIIAPGAAANIENRLMIANLIRTILLAQLFFVPGTILTGVLQTFRYFFIPAVASVLYNVGIIVGLIFFSHSLSIYAPVLGMIIGSFLFLLVQFPLAGKVGLRFVFGNFFIAGVVRVFSLSLPRTIALVANRVNDMVNVVLASLVSQGAIVVFNFAQTLQLAPVGIFGASMAQAILPTFSIIYGKKDLPLLRQVFTSTFHQLLFIILPLSSILAVLRIPIVRLVFGASNFPWEATVTTGRILIIFSFSLFSQVLNILFSRVFYAMHDTKIPLLATVISVAVNISLSVFFILVQNQPIQFLALSFSLGSILQSVLLFTLLRRKLGGLNMVELLWPTGKIVVASFLMAVALYIPMKLLDQLVFDTTRTLPLIFLTSIAGLSGLLVYAFLAWTFNIGEMSVILSFLRRFRRVRKAVPEAEIVNGKTTFNP